MATAQIINCLVCMEPVRPRQQGVQCDGCFRWSHSRADGKSQLPLYLLISFLHREARLTSFQIRLVSERKLRRIQWKKFRNLQTKIFALWDEFNSGDCSARKLLKACSHLNGPAAS